MRARSGIIVGVAILLAITGIPVHTTARAPFDRIVVFGTSLSDSETRSR